MFSAAQFFAKGYSRLPQLLGSAELTALNTITIDTAPQQQANTLKQLWQTTPAILQLAQHPEILTLLKQLFASEGFYLWGASIVERAGGEIHPWHTDAETAARDGGFVSVWIALDGCSPVSSLSFIAGSHQLGYELQSIFGWGSSARSDPRAVEIVRTTAANGRVTHCESVSCSDGDAVLFDGRSWHGSFNHAAVARKALLLQYGAHRQPVRYLQDRQAYPFVMATDRFPSVLNLSGQAKPTKNHYLQIDGDQLRFANMAIVIRPELINEEQLRWKRFPYFETDSEVMAQVICHASELSPGTMPHLPHQHQLEEVLVVLSGQPTIFSEVGAEQSLTGIAAEPGDLFYYPAGHHHTLYNSGATPCHYLMFRWIAYGDLNADAAPRHFKLADYQRRGERFSVDIPSSRLAFLHMHLSTLDSSTGYPAHVDTYDAAMLVLSGQLSCLENQLGSHGVFYIKAGELHDSHNQSTSLCSYLVLEFHKQ